MRIFEVDENLADLKKDIKQSVEKETDISLLKKVSSTLQSGTLLTRLSTILKADPDASKIFNHLSKVIVQTEGTLEDKTRFVDNYSKGFINISKLLTLNKIQNLSDIITDPFALKIFNELNVITAQGIGPGELALSVLSPNITSIGSKSGGGDLVINSKHVELKDSITSGGRWGDPRKAKLDMTSISRSLEKNYPELFAELEESKASLTGPRWITVRDTYGPKSKQKAEVADVIVKSTFKFVKDTSITDTLRKQIMSGSEPELRKAWAVAIFENYKTYSNFELMLCIRTTTQTSLCFSDYTQNINNVKVESIQLWGPEGSVSPKIDIVGTAKAGKAIATEPGAPSKPKDLSVTKTARKQQNPEPVKTRAKR